MGFAIAVEHENSEHSEEEFWKLLHIHVPLKVLISYPRNPQNKIEHFNELMNDEVFKFQKPPRNEQYLVIFGPRREKGINLYPFPWKAWSCSSSSKNPVFIRL